MPRSYCQVADVQNFLPLNIIVTGEYSASVNPANPAPSSLNISTVNWFIQSACDMIDGRLGTIYDTPLKMVNQGGVVGYPALIVRITALLTADLVYKQRLQGADRQKSDSLKEDLEWAYSELDRIQNGESRIQGQKFTRGSRFVNSTLPNMPINPISGGRTKGGRG